MLMPQANGGGFRERHATHDHFPRKLLRGPGWGGLVHCRESPELRAPFPAARCHGPSRVGRGRT
ncbi:MAG: hypothetical protein RL091_2627 [Verrucomicrobiota bacterium]